jgi:hypothetical protein
LSYKTKPRDEDDFSTLFKCYISAPADETIKKKLAFFEACKQQFAKKWPKDAEIFKYFTIDIKIVKDHCNIVANAYDTNKRKYLVHTIMTNLQGKQEGLWSKRVCDQAENALIFSSYFLRT